ncbi:NRAMP family divalent metal transporter [uncultured Prochlorococcus sp.]|uniref:NRAMP family divalent metal transporter n=1 Tax=uncultured Prochlorococcus sp. TaxID=159733 RepID=UPI00258A30E2|nr:divalent metal cation transporter [uncultured Prochlorococcus sp.]
MNFTKRIQKSSGPGILLAGAAIGGSHLFSSTTAGARFGFSLLGLILLTNLLKYPFLLVGTRFTASTGKSLLEGFKERNSYYLPLFLIVSLITGTFTIAAVSILSGALLTNIPFFSFFPEINLSILVLGISGMILILGKYKALDRISKFLVALLTFLTLFAVLSLLFKGSMNDSLKLSFFEPEVSPWKLTNLAFLIPLMGWMPCPVELCVWPSLWMFSRAKDANYKPNVREAEFDFNLGYVITVVTAIFFLTLGAITMYGTGDGMLSSGGGSFAQKLIYLYTESIGDWSKWIIVPAAFAAMFSTTITCLDAYPRSISAIQGLLIGTDLGRMDSKAERNRFQWWMIVHIFASFIALLIAKSQGLGVKEFVFPAMTGSFLTAPLFAWMAMDTINSKLVPSKNRYGLFLKTFCWIGLIFLTLFSLLFIANSFFGIGVG